MVLQRQPVMTVSTTRYDNSILYTDRPNPLDYVQAEIVIICYLRNCPVLFYIFIFSTQAYCPLLSLIFWEHCKGRSSSLSHALYIYKSVDLQGFQDLIAPPPFQNS